MTGLTPRMAELRNWITVYEAKHQGRGPTYDEMAAGIGTTKSNAHRIASCLRERGYLESKPRSARSITVIKPDLSTSLDIAREHVAYALNSNIPIREVLKAVFGSAPESIDLKSAVEQLAMAWERLHEERQ